MTSGFTKLFNSIITSSIWSEDDKVRIMWITFLAASDAKGFVSGTIPGMAAIARMSIPEAKQAIQKLESPDPYSRSNKREGARVIKCNDGWMITNYLKYRQKRDPEKRRKQNREAQRRYKEKQKANQSKQKVSQNKPESAQAEAEAEAERERGPQPSKNNFSFIEYWKSKGNLRQIRSFTEQRKTKLKTRIAERLFADNWQQVIDKISASRFCTGHNDRGWKADVDWILENGTNYIKVLEGKYDNNDEQKPKTIPFDEDAAKQRGKMLVAGAK